MSVRLDRLQEGLFRVFQDYFGPSVTVSWAHNEPSFEQMQNQLISFQLLSGPSKMYQTRPRGTSFLPPESITFTVPNAVEGELYSVIVDNIQYAHTATGLDTVDTIRDSLVALIEGDDFAEYSAASTANPGEFVLTPDSFAAIYQCSHNENLSLTNLALSENAALYTRGVRQCVVQCQAFSKNKNPRSGAQRIMDKIMDLSEQKRYSNLLWDYGLAVINWGSPIDLTAIAGGSWETRSNCDLTINLDSGVTEPTDSVENIAFSVSLQDSGNAIEKSFTS